MINSLWLQVDRPAASERVTVSARAAAVNSLIFVLMLFRRCLVQSILHSHGFSRAGAAKCKTPALVARPPGAAPAATRGDPAPPATRS